MSRISVVEPGGDIVAEEKAVTGKLQFDRVYGEGKSWAGKEIVVRALPNGLPLTRFGFTVSRRVGKAVVRNRVKRLLREIVRRLPVQSGWDVVLIARIPAATADYTVLNRSVRALLNRAGLLTGENESNSPATN